MRSALSFGAEEPKIEPGGEFELDSNLVDTLYNESIGTLPGLSRASSSNLQLNTQFSMMSPSVLNLSNKYFDVAYTDQVRSFPFLNLALTKSLLRLGRLALLVQGKLGYTYKEGIYEVRSNTSNLRTDLLKLHWLPISASLKFEYGFSGVTFIKPHFTVGSGAQWLYQTGRLDGIEQGFWIPFYAFSPGITLFEQEGISDWFGGVTFSGTYQSSFSSPQLIRGWSVDVGLNVLL